MKVYSSHENTYLFSRLCTVQLQEFYTFFLSFTNSFFKHQVNITHCKWLTNMGDLTHWEEFTTTRLIFSNVSYGSTTHSQNLNIGDEEFFFSNLPQRFKIFKTFGTGSLSLQELEQHLSCFINELLVSISYDLRLIVCKDKIISPVC